MSHLLAVCFGSIRNTNLSPILFSLSSSIVHEVERLVGSISSLSLDVRFLGTAVVVIVVAAVAVVIVVVAAVVAAAVDDDNVNGDVENLNQNRKC